MSKLRETYGIKDVPDVDAENASGVRVEDDPWFSLIEDAADIITEKLPPQVEIVERTVCEHSKLIIGSGAKAFKTWLTIYMALCIAHGFPFLGCKTSRRRVLYLNLELKPQTFKRRVQAIAEALNIKVDREWFVHLPLRGKMSKLSVDDMVTRIVRFAAHLKSGVVVADPVYKMNVEGGEENSAGVQTLFFNQLDRITTEAKATLILNDHFSKGNQSEKDPLDAIRGSGAKGGDVDAAMILRKHEVEGCFRVDMVHRELPGVEPFCIGWNYPLMELRPDLDPESMKKPKGGRKPSHDPIRLLSAIKDATVGNPVSVIAWAVAAGINRTTLNGYLPGLRSKGFIATAGEGNTARQYVTDSGRAAVEEYLN